MVLSGRTRGNGQIRIQEFLSQHWEALLCCVGDGALTQAAWRLWGLLLGDLPKLPERGPGCPALGVPSGASGPRGPCQPQSSCGSVASGSM